MKVKFMWIVLLVLVSIIFGLSFTSFEIRSEIEISADKEKVWKVITDFSTYSNWNSQLQFLGGEVKPEGKIHLRLSAAGNDPYEFKPVISHWIENEKFAWLAITGLPRLFDGEHFFELRSLDNGNTLLINREEYRGILSLIMKQLPMMKEAPKGFLKMNKEIKSKVENS